MPEPLLKLRLARANFDKARQQWLDHARKVHDLNGQLADAVISLQAAQQYQAPSLLIEQLTALIQSLSNAMAREESYLPACKKALKTAREKLNEVKACLYPTKPRRSLSALSYTNTQISVPLPPAPILENRYASAPPTLNTTQPMNAQWAPLTRYRKLDDLAKAVLTLKKAVKY